VRTESNGLDLRTNAIRHNAYLDFYLYSTNPQAIKTIDVRIDCNPSTLQGTDHALFRNHYYFHRVYERGKTAAEDPAAALQELNLEYSRRYNEIMEKPIGVLPDGFYSEAQQQNAIAELDRWYAAEKANITSTAAVSPQESAGWRHYTIPLQNLKGIGQPRWATTKALQVVWTVDAGNADTLGLDEFVLLGGRGSPQRGEYRYRYVYVDDQTNYQAKSSPSEVSDSANLAGEGATVTIPSDSDRPYHVDQVWIYRQGGFLDTFYRVAVLPVSGTGALTWIDAVSDIDALTGNEKLEWAVGGPPEGIIGVAGPYYDRIFTLTDQYLYPSKIRNPEVFSTIEAIRVGEVGEKARWVALTSGGLYIGTNKTIKQLSGTGAPFPDGTFDWTLRDLNVGTPPIASAVAQEGNFIIYLASDGWRVFDGVSSHPIAGETSLLYHGYARYGVSALNLLGAVVNSEGSLWAAAIAQGQLFALVPEGSSDDPTALYRFDMERRVWSRHLYAATLLSVARQADGTILAGDDEGHVWDLETGTQDEGTDIDVLLRTISDDDGRPDVKKDGQDYRITLDTGGDPATVGLHVDGADSPAHVIEAVTDGTGAVQEVLNLDFTRDPAPDLGEFLRFPLARMDAGLSGTASDPAPRRGETPLPSPNATALRGRHPVGGHRRGDGERRTRAGRGSALRRSDRYGRAANRQDQPGSRYGAGSLAEDSQARRQSHGGLGEDARICGRRSAVQSHRLVGGGRRRGSGGSGESDGGLGGGNRGLLRRSHRHRNSSGAVPRAIPEQDPRRSDRDLRLSDESLHARRDGDHHALCG
jgi:hypothetical protein